MEQGKRTKIEFGKCFDYPTDFEGLRLGTNDTGLIKVVESYFRGKASEALEMGLYNELSEYTGLLNEISFSLTKLETSEESKEVEEEC